MLINPLTQGSQFSQSEAAMKFLGDDAEGGDWLPGNLSNTLLIGWQCGRFGFQLLFNTLRYFIKIF